MSWPAPVTLAGKHATLVPLEPSHAGALAEAVRDGELWRLWYTAIPSPLTAIENSALFHAAIPSSVRELSRRYL